MAQGKFFMVSLLVLGFAGLLGCQSSSSDGVRQFTGFLENDTIDVAADVGGRVTAVSVQEGDWVEADQPLTSIDDDLVRAKLAVADANIAVAQAQLALLESGPRAEELVRAQAQVEKARAVWGAATAALSDTIGIRAHPQTLLIAQAQADVRAKVAAQQLQAAASQAQSADVINSFLEQQTRMLWDGFTIYMPGGPIHFNAPGRLQIRSQEEWQKAGNTSWQAWAGVQQAQANVNAAEANWKDITDKITDPIALDTRVDQARAARDRAEAGVHAAEAAQQVLRDGASPAQLQAARAVAEQTRRARATLEQEQERYRLYAPQAGTVTQVFCRSGEVVLPGAPLVRVSVAGDLTLRVYIPMSALDRLRIGNVVAVSVEGINGRTFDGVVQRTGDRAEFTGRQPQTDNERNAQLVVLEISIRNPAADLKAGMPASITIK